MRWLAAQLKLSPSMMSNVLSGKRNLPPYLLDKVCDLLDISKSDRDLMLQTKLQQAGYMQIEAENLSKSRPSSSKIRAAWERATSKDLDVIKDWYYVAILEISRTKDFDGNATSIAKRLNLPLAQVKLAMDEMIDAGLLSYQNGMWRKSTDFLEMQSKKTPDILRKIHISHLENAKNILTHKLTDADKAKRLITGITLTVSKDQIDTIRLKIADFVKDISSEASSENPDSIYHFAVQFYPLDDNQ